MNGYFFEDILGFTRQTETLITGLGGTPDLVEEFRKRNISTEELAELTEYDLINLGADYSFISSFLKQMKNTPKKTSEYLMPSYRFEHLLDILKTGRHHIKFIGAFIAFVKLRLEGEQINLFVDADKGLRASETLKIASMATLQEVDSIMKEVENLETYISTTYKAPKKRKIYKICMVIGGLGLTTCALFHLCKKCYIKL